MDDLEHSSPLVQPTKKSKKKKSITENAKRAVTTVSDLAMKGAQSTKHAVESAGLVVKETMLRKMSFGTESDLDTRPTSFSEDGMNHDDSAHVLADGTNIHSISPSRLFCTRCQVALDKKSKYFCVDCKHVFCRSCSSCQQLSGSDGDNKLDMCSTCFHNMLNPIASEVSSSAGKYST